MKIINILNFLVAIIRMATKKKTLRFGNSQVRNQELHGNTVQYKVATKTTNGPSAVSNSAMRVNQKANPQKYQWDSSKSYTNTFDFSASNRATSMSNYQQIRQNYGNNWVDATVAINTYKESLADVNKMYKAKLTKHLIKDFGNPSPEILRELIYYVEELNAVVAKWHKKILDTYSADKAIEGIFDSAKEFLQIDTNVLKKLYPEYRDLFLKKSRIINKARTLRQKTLKELRNARTMKNKAVA
jgi:hypothetical protein